jgi:flagellar biosynthesis protein FlhG
MAMNSLSQSAFLNFLHGEKFPESDHRQGAIRTPKIISFSSGKGGVGKTMTTINFGLCLRHLGYRVLILDGDFGLSNVDIVLGLQAKYNISDVLNGNASISDIAVEGPLGIRVVPSGSGINGLSHLTETQRQILTNELQKYACNFDFLLIDTGAGISENVLHLNSLADRMVVVTSSEPHAMTDAYALIKVMSECYPDSEVSLLVNMCGSMEEGLKIYRRMSEVAARYLQVSFGFLGHVPRDPQLQKLLFGRRGGAAEAIHTVAGQAWKRCATELLSLFVDAPGHGRASKFWTSFAGAESSMA